VLVTAASVVVVTISATTAGITEPSAKAEGSITVKIIRAHGGCLGT
jgi:hypothetical protein